MTSSSVPLVGAPEPSFKSHNSDVQTTSGPTIPNGSPTSSADRQQALAADNGNSSKHITDVDDIVTSASNAANATGSASTKDTNAPKAVQARFQDISRDMDKEFVQYSTEQFIQTCLPFSPSDAAVDACVKSMLGKDHIPVDTVASATSNLNESSAEPRRSTRTQPKALPKASVINRTALLSEKRLKGPDGKEIIIQRFTHYEASPKDQGTTEKIAFAPLERIAKAVGEYSKVCDGRARNDYNYKNCPNNKILSCLDGSNNMVDACFVTGDDLHTTNIAAPIEQKLRISDRYSNNAQIVSANVHIMNDDVRRMFTFGITFENNEVTLWYHCRSHSAISTPFNFVENPRLLIKVFLSFMFATHKELGYDPDVTLVDRKQRQFTFRIPDDAAKQSYKFYRTVSVVAEYRSSNITGRMARVWLVDRVDSDGKILDPQQCILKDVWLEQTARTEKKIQQEIFQDIEKFCHPDSLEYKLCSSALEDSPEESLNNIKIRNAELVKSGAYKEYFLHIEQDSVGEVSKEVASNHKPVTGLFKAPVVQDDQVRSVLSTDSTTLPQDPPRRYSPRRQYRVIFKEVCKAIGNIERLGDVVDIIRQAVTPLSLMYCAGWVHRDISSGNILSHRKGKILRAKLSDLEYAKRFNTQDTSGEANTDPKTGTPFFMPVEVMQRSLFFTHVWGWGKRKSAVKRYAKSKAPDPPNPKSQTKTPVVIYNFQHDLESLWWLLVWSITARVNHDKSRNWSEFIYRNTPMPTVDRVNFIKRDDSTQQEDPLEKVLLPSLLPSFLQPVNVLRSAMMTDYQERSKDSKITDTESYAPIHDDFATVLNTLHSKIPHSQWAELPLLGSKPDLINDPPQSAPLVPIHQPKVYSAKPARKRLPSDDQPYESDHSEELNRDPDEDVETTLRRASKRQKASSGRASNLGGSSQTSRSRGKTTTAPKTRSSSKGKSTSRAKK